MRFPAWPKSLVIAVVAAMLSACGTSGNNFSAGSLADFVPGETTLAQASALLGSYPEQTYATTEGAVTALWSFQATGLDHLLYRKSALVQFGPDGTFRRIVDTTGVTGGGAGKTHQRETAGFPCGSEQSACP